MNSPRGHLTPVGWLWIGVLTFWTLVILALLQ